MVFENPVTAAVRLGLGVLVGITGLSKTLCSQEVYFIGDVACMVGNIVRNFFCAQAGIAIGALGWTGNRAHRGGLGHAPDVDNNDLSASR